MSLVSIVIPCYNPPPFLAEAIASARNQTHRPIEVILVDDGTDSAEGRACLDAVRPEADHYIKQANQGLAAARNSGFRAAAGDFVVPLDADDVLEPSYVEKCLAFISVRQEAAFVFTDYRVFGVERYVERLPDYNLYDLLGRNSLTYAALIRRDAWERAAGYDERFRFGYEDWDFWLRLAEHGRYGCHLAEVLWRYRKHGPSSFKNAHARHSELVGLMRTAHPALFSPGATARIKGRWRPSVCIIGALAADPALLDVQTAEPAAPAQIIEQSSAPAFLIPARDSASPLAPEWAALAVWGGKRSSRLPDGSTAISRQALLHAGNSGLLRLLKHTGTGYLHLPGLVHRMPGPFIQLRRHLHNSGLTRLETWRERPLDAALRLIPFELKMRINRLAGRRVFDLSFYLRFQPSSVFLGESLIEPPDYVPRFGPRRRVAFVTPHLGPGGAESVLMEIASSLDRSEYELFLVATQSRDPSWGRAWEARVDHVYDLASLVPERRVPGALFSLLRNWSFDRVLIQNSLAAYSILPQLKQARPQTWIADVVHSADPAWDLSTTTLPAAPHFDLRVAISDTVRSHLARLGVPPERIRVIRNGIDIERFSPRPESAGRECKRILFAGRLDPVKRPLLLADIAAELLKLRPIGDFEFVVAGDGPERRRLENALRRRGLSGYLRMLGQVDDMAPLMRDVDLLVLPSRSEGLPIVVLEALATCVPVVASDVGSIAEAVDHSCGILVPIGPGEAALLGAALNRLLDDARLRQAMGAAGRAKIASSFDSRRSKEEYRCLLGAG